MADNTQQTPASTGLCADCLIGFSFAGTPRGEVIKLGPFQTVYVASQGEVTGKPALVMFTDVFGLGVCLMILIDSYLLNLHSWSIPN